jgi:hypothetical protein
MSGEKNLVFDKNIQSLIVIFFQNVSGASASELRFDITNPMPPKPTRATLSPGRESLSRILSSKAPRSTKSGSRGNGTVDSGHGVGSGCSMVESGHQHNSAKRHFNLISANLGHSSELNRY